MNATHIILLLLIGYIVFSLDKKQENIPVPPVLVLIGISLSFVPYFDSIAITETTLYDIFLPALLFTSAYRYPPKALREHGGLIGALSTVGLLITAVLFGLVIYSIGGFFLPLSFIGAMVIASILTPTDPVSVVSILKQSADNPKVADVVEGESMINDGTSIVLFTFLSGMYLHQEELSVSSFINEFLLVSLGGALLGIFCGWAVSKAVHFTHHKEYQVMLSIILAYGIFLVAEHIGVSGVLATVGAGIMLSWEFEHTNKEDHYRESLDGFWDIVEPTILSIVFLLIGIEAASYLAFNYWILSIVIFIASLLIRYLVLFGTIKIFPAWRKDINAKEITIMSWSGIRGTMSVVLILALQAESGSGEADYLLSLSFSVVLISLIVQSLGIFPLSRSLLKK
ncbi:MULTISPECIES: cation:proton antiporter [Pontibacillus]|uniref:Sodium:proton antiporter n=1 Tax=Pontibacillus chungwhensis TaxID=265426 RepID=A0ABY8UYY5_9BACI|nr:MULTISPECIES: sodium:proton antiporter [Pontibacillus]MCD5323490.1 sodium:proton antiporter [Pontibacillus sp. HN14]WIF96866.1 sodium:proton antiporter [Pontibacillus chungwhensis]